jgi:hypothetical protein
MWIFEPDNTSRRTTIDSTHQKLYINASIHTRGQYSQSFRKKQFALSPLDPLGAEVEISLLGMPAGSGNTFYVARNL